MGFWGGGVGGAGLGGGWGMGDWRWEVGVEGEWRGSGGGVSWVMRCLESFALFRSSRLEVRYVRNA